MTQARPRVIAQLQEQVDVLQQRLDKIKKAGATPKQKAGGDGRVSSPPSLSSAEQPALFELLGAGGLQERQSRVRPVLKKTVFSDKYRFAFLAGIEGTGHHYWNALWPVSAASGGGGREGARLARDLLSFWNHQVASHTHSPGAAPASLCPRQCSCAGTLATAKVT